MTKIALVQIPHGVPVGNTWLDHVGLREINGYDEQMLSENYGYPLPFKTTALLGRVLRFSKSNEFESVSEKTIARKLTLGDRIALILHLRRLTFGDKLQLTLVCPACMERMSIDLSVSHLLLPVVAVDPKMEYSIKVEQFTLEVRPLIGADLESLFAGVDTLDKEERLARRCIMSSDPALPDRLSADFLDKLGSEFEDLDQQATMVLNLNCPNCQHSFQSPFNAEDFLFSELDAGRKLLEREVHWLAFNYHWTEDTILSLPVRKRKRYVDLVNSTLSGESI